MIIATRTQIVTDPVVVWPADLQFLDKALRKEFANINYSAVLEDGTKLELDSLNALLEYENPDFKRIASISVHAGAKSVADDAVEIVLGEAKPASTSNGSIFYRLTDINRLARVENELTSRIRAMRPWYHLLTRVDFVSAFLLLLLTLWFGANLWSLINRYRGVPRPPSGGSPITEGESIVFLTIVCVVLYLVGRAMNISREFLFPRVFFCLGRQEGRYRHRERIAQLVFVVIGLGIIVNLLAKAIWP